MEELTIGFVPPRYGDEVVGGAEAVMAEAAHGLAKRGHKVEVITTCAIDHYTWKNEYAPGLDNSGLVPVRRFAIDHNSNGVARKRIGDSILANAHVPVEAQQLWANDSLRSSEMWHYLSENMDSYRCLIFAPYQFWTTYACGQIDSSKTIIMPCMHEEPEARFDIYQPVLNGAEGIWFLTDPEADLTNEIYNLTKSQQIVGAAVDVPASYDPTAFCEKYGITSPFIYYAGRREWGKGWQDLLAGFAKALDRTDIKLVTSGVGELGLTEELEKRVIDVGFISDNDRNNAMAAALAYVQPSDRESFSRTVLEAWLAGTPVIANARSAVVAWHIDRSEAGYAYSGVEDLGEAIVGFANNPSAAKDLASTGRDYVLTNYQWDSILDNMEHTLANWFPVGEGE